jgi:hypothetical protein
MAEDRALDVQRVTAAMDSTRLSIRDTLGELKERIQETADWRHQVRRRPVASFWVAILCGVALARVLIPAAGSARRLVSRSGGSSRSRLPALPALSGAVGLLTQLATLRSLVTQVRRVVGQFSSKPRA